MQSSIGPMQQFDENTLADLEKLCRIQCTPEEKEDILSSLKRALEYIHLLNEVDIQGAPSCNFVLRGMLKRVLREDEVNELLPTELFFSNVPDRIGGLVRVPPVLKKS